MTSSLFEKNNLRGVVSVTNNWELNFYKEDWDDWEKKGLSHIVLPTIEYEPPSIADIDKGIKFIENITMHGGATYVHCKAGRIRSATLVACYLLKNSKDLLPDTVIDYIKSKRKQIQIHDEEREVINECFELYRLHRSNSTLTT